MKKRITITRVVDSEKTSFNPLVFTTSGGMEQECTNVNGRLDEKRAEKRREPYVSGMTYIRTLRFALLGTPLLQYKAAKANRAMFTSKIMDCHFNLIPKIAIL